ncbi:MAG TPA: hypothetical protein VLL05_06640 [Terriglobales bacterium]|nr:hypothetical protein [Terriglobales bacterium]
MSSRVSKIYGYWVLELLSIDERVRKLCAKAATAEGREVEEVLEELRAALREHARFVRQMSARTFTRVHEKQPSFRNDD